MMGGNCSRVSPVAQPTVVNQPKQQHVTEGHLFERTINDNRRLVNDLIESQKSIIIENLTGNTDFVEIEVADPQAFNKRFIQQRQQAINNTSYRSTVGSWRPHSLDELVNMIKSLSANKSLIDCHWIIFYWIACNIKFDPESYFRNNHEDQSAENVFQKKKAVCIGYANIYQYICDKLNIPCVKISGYSKGYGFDQRQGAPTDTHHGWNAVQIDNHWYLVESVWGIGYLTEQKKFQSKLIPYYFLARPEEMIYHHLPENEKWQLLRRPVKMKQYLNMPKLRPVYFELNLDLVIPRNQFHVDLLPEKSYAVVLLRAPSDVHLKADLKLNNKSVEGGHRIIFDKEHQIYCFYFAPSTIGQHEIMIYGKRGNIDDDAYDEVLDLTLDINQIPKNPVSFPKTWTKFFDLNLQVVSPKNTHLIKLRDHQNHTEILIQAPSDVELLGRLVNSSGEKIEGADQVFYNRQKHLWQCRFAPNKDGIFNAEILAKRKTDPGLCTPVVSFQLDAKNIPIPHLSYPLTWQFFYDLDLKIEYPLNRCSALWSEKTSFTEIRISAPDDADLSCSIEYNGVRQENCTLAQYDHDKKHWQLLFAPQCTGLHQLLIFGRRQNSSHTSYRSVAQFDLNVTKLQQPIRFPQTYAGFQTKKCQIYEPLCGIIKKNTTVPIHCFIPGVASVDLQVDSKWVETKGYQDPIYKTDVRVGSKDVIIYAKYDRKGKFDALIQYSVE